MATVYISVGSNIEPERNVRAAMRMLAERVRVLAISTFYRTSPLGSPGSPDFYNGMIEAETSAAPRELKFGVLHGIERALGRVRGPDRHAPRTIDLDITVYDDVIVNEPDLVIPDGDILARPFLAIPLLELAPNLVIPGHGLSLAEVAARHTDHEMTELPEFTRALRMEILDGQRASCATDTRTADRDR